MTRAAKLIPAASLAAVFVLACSGAEPPAPSKVEVAEVVVDAGQAPAAVQDGAPTIASDEAVFDFGAITASDEVEHVFKVRNAGTADLKIERVQRT